MATTIWAVFDGETLRPLRPTDLRPNTTYVLTVEEDSVRSEGANKAPYPLTEIADLATDMGVSDMAEQHDRYAHGRAQAAGENA